MLRCRGYREASERFSSTWLKGAKLIPLAWVRAVKSIRTSRPFLELPERFGLMPDPENAAGLPIGVTAALSRGAEVLGPMVGVNCAACHVGALTYQEKTYPLLGAATCSI